MRTFWTRADEFAEPVDAQAAVSARRAGAFVDVDLAAIAGERRRAQARLALVLGVDDASAVVQAFVLTEVRDVKTMVKSCKRGKTINSRRTSR